MTDRAERLLAVLLAAAGLAAGALAWEAHGERRRNEVSREFQGLVRGLGAGPAIDLAECPFCFDPRVAGGCAFDTGPVAGAGWLCPHHACSVLHLRCPLPRDLTAPRDADDAQVP